MCNWYHITQAMATCGALNQDCCYGLEEELCMAGPCDPGFPRPDPNDFKAFPCLCSSTVCVRNIQYCAPDQICDQSSDVPDCGGLGEPCCDGINCNEDIEDDNGNFYDLLCIPADGEGKQVNVCARPEEPVLEQSFGCGGLGEKCCRDGACNGSGLCSCAYRPCQYSAVTGFTLHTISFTDMTSCSRSVHSFIRWIIVFSTRGCMLRRGHLR